eukprot:5553151-Pyramimonas_sp.AAC.1
MIESCVSTIASCEVFMNIEDAAPLDIKQDDAKKTTKSGDDSGFQAPYSEVMCAASMKRTKVYQCGANLFWCDIMSSAAPGVPNRVETTRALSEFYYPEGEMPTYFEGTIVVNVPSGTVESSEFGHFKLVSPEEAVHAALMACARDINNEAERSILEAWKVFFLTVTMRFIVVEEHLLFFKAKTLRNAVVQEYDSLARTAFQEICEIANLKSHMEVTAGKHDMSVQEVVDIYNERSKRAECQEQL